MKRVVAVCSLLATPVFGQADIPDWYERDISVHLSRADAVVLYRVDSISLEAHAHNHFLYRIDSTTIEELKGRAPKGSCYLVQTESEWEYSDDLGALRLAILTRRYDSDCSLIEPGYGAPGTEEYVSLFRKLLEDDT